MLFQSALQSGDDYAHRSKQRTLTLTSEEFLRRFLQHV